MESIGPFRYFFNGSLEDLHFILPASFENLSLDIEFTIFLVYLLITPYIKYLIVDIISQLLAGILGILVFWIWRNRWLVEILLLILYLSILSIEIARTISTGIKALVMRTSSCSTDFIIGKVHRCHLNNLFVEFQIIVNIILLQTLIAFIFLQLFGLL